jgi:uncharacterized phage protein (TIGR01671 family)
MNRPIKFRVWDKRENKGMSTQNMLYDAQLHHLWQDFVDYPGSYELMQYTGLTDSNDNPIYEGDILMYKTGSIPTTGVIGQVLYEADEGGYIFQWERKGPNQNYKNLNCDVAFESVIVGNIFEHSELLK